MGWCKDEFIMLMNDVKKIKDIRQELEQEIVDIEEDMMWQEYDQIRERGWQ